MKRYLLFVFDTYYPSGGWGDFKDSFDTLNDMYHALVNIPFGTYDHYQVVDIQTGKVEMER